jgi:hypothetical protein
MANPCKNANNGVLIWIFRNKPTPAILSQGYLKVKFILFVGPVGG